MCEGPGVEVEVEVEVGGGVRRGGSLFGWELSWIVTGERGGFEAGGGNGMAGTGENCRRSWGGGIRG